MHKLILAAVLLAGCSTAPQTETCHHLNLAPATTLFETTEPPERWDYNPDPYFLQPDLSDATKKDDECAMIFAAEHKTGKPVKCELYGTMRIAYAARRQYDLCVARHRPPEPVVNQDITPQEKHDTDLAAIQKALAGHWP